MVALAGAGGNLELGYIYVLKTFLAKYHRLDNSHFGIRLECHSYFSGHCHLSGSDYQVNCPQPLEKSRKRSSFQENEKIKEEES